MLTHLLIKNYALIEHLELSPSPKLNIITGETGAGKSIMLGAVGLLMGKRAETKVLHNENNKCIIEGEFDITLYKLETVFKTEELDYSASTIIRREISSAGKSRAFINDTPVTLDVLKKIGAHLMDVHSQHETLNLGKSTFQLAFIDTFAKSTALRKDYLKSYKAFKKQEQSLQLLRENATKIEQEADYNKFLYDELNNAKLEVNEQVGLEENVKISEHAEEIKIKLNEVLEVLSNSEYSAINAIQHAKNLFIQLNKYSDKYSTISSRIESMAIELQDIVAESEKKEQEISFDPEETVRLQDRLSLIYSLQQKHHVQDIKSLIEIKDNLENKVALSENIDDEINKATIETERLKKESQEKASKLSEARKEAFLPITVELIDLLKNVGILEAQIEIQHSKTELTNHGIDDINILFSANKGISPQPLAKVASGGEYSRLMFCIKYILADKIALPTIIFDEIDTGVSGEIALKLGTMMRKMALNHQVITISHLPQIAAKGHSHYFVYKDSANEKSISKIRPLNSEDRILEIAKMIGGDQPAESAFESAKSLLKHN